MEPASVLFASFLGQPVWMWLIFVAAVAVLLVLDLGVLNRGSREIGVRRSLMLSAMYVALGLGFGGFVWWQLGPQSGLEYLTGFVVEKSLAMDNVFVIAMIFGALAIPRAYQHRVLFWGILGVIVLRGIMIGVGATLVARHEWILLVFAAFLIVTGLRMLLSGDDDHGPPQGRLFAFLRRNMRVTNRLHGERFFVRRTDRSGRRLLFATPLFLALAMVEIADVIFAVDSVPAIFAITTDPYIVYTSNIFAILGLRALYFALAAVIHRFAGLKPALAVLLVFIGGKVIVAEMLGIEKVPPAVSLGVTFAILAAGVGWSLWRTRDDAPRAIANKG